MNAGSLPKGSSSLPGWLVGVFLAFVTLATPCVGEVADGYLQRWVTKRTKQMNASFVRGQFESMGWAGTIGEALKLAAKHKRPVFLFTLDGHMNSGRC